MMPFSNEKSRRIYVAALVISFLLIVGSIYLHCRQKTHLGRMSFNLDRDRVKPTSGVETTTWLEDNDLKFTSETYKRSNTDDDSAEDNGILEASTPLDDNIILHNTRSRKFHRDDINEENDENNKENVAKVVDDQIDKIIDEMNEDIEDNSEYNIRSLAQDSSACLRCLCMTVNECRATFCGSGNPCGLYRISKSYWIDGGRPTIAGGSTDNEDQDYLTCVNEDTCATTVIHQYYNLFRRDCNKDGLFDCRDQIALHLLGPSGCLTKSLSYIHASRMKNCLIESNLHYFSYSSEEEY